MCPRPAASAELHKAPDLGSRTEVDASVECICQVRKAATSFSADHDNGGLDTMGLLGAVDILQ